MAAPVASSSTPLPPATPFSPAPAPAKPSGALPAPPQNAIVFDQIQNDSDGWKDCSLCAEGTHSTDNFWMAPFQSSPSMTGSSRELFVGGPTWTNVLYIKTIPGNSAASHFLWDFYFYLDPTSAANVWATEFDLWQVVGGREFMIGSQCAVGDGHWDTWDQNHNKWITISIPCPRWTPSTWHHVQWFVERLVGTDQYRYDTLVVDGEVHNINQIYETSPTAWSDAIGIQWQLDQSSTGVPLHQWIDNVKLTVW
jgi:hypothetical protein